MRRSLEVLVLLLLVAGACGSDGRSAGVDPVPSEGPGTQPATEPTGPRVEVRVTGTLEGSESGWSLCPGAVAPCWTVISADTDGLEPGLVVAEGTWQADTIALREVRRLEEPPSEPVQPCEGQELGQWNEIPGAPAAIRDSTPELAALWLAPDQQTLVVIVTDRVDETRTRLAAQGFDGVCVADLGFEHTLDDLEGAQRDMADHLAEWGDQGWIATSLGIDMARNVIDARFDEVDQRLRAQIEDRWGSLVEITAAVEVLDGTVEDLTIPASAREIAIATQPRGAGGMDALGTFTLRYDAAQDCLWFEGSEGERVKPIWPHGTIALRDPFVVLDGRGQPLVAVGQEIETGGGFGRVLPDSDDPTDCGATEVWVIAPPG